jgi:hypothetical protein
MAKKFIRGLYEIKDKINNLDKFVKINKAVFDELVTFGNNNGVGFNIGTGYDGTILCEYNVIRPTKKECETALSGFKYRLKMIFKKIERRYEGRGDKIF